MAQIQDSQATGINVNYRYTVEEALQEFENILEKSSTEELFHFTYLQLPELRKIYRSRVQELLQEGTALSHLQRSRLLFAESVFAAFQEDKGTRSLSSKALGEAKRALTQENSPEAYLTFCCICEFRDSISVALRETDRGLKKYPEDAKLHNAYARLLDKRIHERRAKNKFELTPQQQAAEFSDEENMYEHYERSISLDPTYPRPVNNLVSLHEKEGRPKEALRTFLQFEKDLEKAGEELSQALYFRIAQIFEKLGQMESAKVYYEKAISGDISYPQAIVHLAATEHALGNPERCIALLEDLVKEKGEEIRAEAVYFLATVYLEADKKVDAERNLKLAIASNPQHLDARLALITMSAAEDGRGRAITSLDELLSQYSWQPKEVNRILHEKARLYLEIGNKEAALQILKDSISKSSSHPQSFLLLAETQQEDGDLDAAIGTFQALRKAHPRRFSADAETTLGALYGQRMRKKETAFQEHAKQAESLEQERARIEENREVSPNCPAAKLAADYRAYFDLIRETPHRRTARIAWTARKEELESRIQDQTGQVKLPSGKLGKCYRKLFAAYEACMVNLVSTEEKLTPIRHHEAALKKQPDHPLALLNMGIQLSKQERSKRAKAFFLKAIEAGSVTAHFYYANLLCCDEDPTLYAEALNHFRSYLTKAIANRDELKGENIPVARNFIRDLEARLA